MSADVREEPLALVANARLPSERAQSLQVVQAAAAFERAGAETTLCFAVRADAPGPQDEEQCQALLDYYAVPRGARPRLVGIECADWIDKVPRPVQYVPGRVQELTFARNAARLLAHRMPEGHEHGTRVLSRELETAHALRGREGLFLEQHRVPAGRLRRSWLLAAGKAAAGVIAISEGVARDLIELGISADKLRVEHDGFEVERFRDLPSKAEARLALGLPVDRPLVAYTGGLLPWKGGELVVEAARALPDVYFVLAGGMQADVVRVRERAADLPNVRLDGFQAPGRVALYLAAADVGVVPNRSQPAISAHYTSPLKVFEAMATGLPLVASDLPSLRAILPDELAYFVAPDNGAALARGIAAALADEGALTAMGTALRAAAADHTWDARAARILDWMRERA